MIQSTVPTFQGIPGLCGIDTRRLTQLLREHGTILGKIVVEDSDVEWYDPAKHNLVKEVSTKVAHVY